MKKTCTKCGVERHLEDFYKDKKGKFGRQASCKVCNKIYRENNVDRLSESKRLYRKNNKTSIAEYHKRWADTNKDSRREYMKNYTKTNKEELSEKRKTYNESNKDVIAKKKKEYKEANRGVFNEVQARRRAAKLQRTPSWLSELEELCFKEIYQQRQDLSRLTGLLYHVDHIIPLQGELVSGLHVPSNLQVILANENLSKSNSFSLEDNVVLLPIQ